MSRECMQVNCDETSPGATAKCRPPFDGKRGGDSSFLVGEVPSTKCSTRGVEEKGSVAHLRGVPGEKTSLSKDEEAEKYLVFSETQLATDERGEET